MSKLYGTMKVQEPFGNKSSNHSRMVKKKNTQCPNHAICPTPCHHAELHWRGTHCNRDRRDDCPSCVTPRTERPEVPEDVLELFS